MGRADVYSQPEDGLRLLASWAATDAAPATGVS